MQSAKKRLINMMTIAAEASAATRTIENPARRTHGRNEKTTGAVSVIAPHANNVSISSASNSQ